MYFKNFPQFLYDFNYDGNKKIKTSIVMDVTRNVRFRKDVMSNVQVYDWYDIVDGETPEIISEKFYGTPYYHWVIMLVNEKYDYRNDFPVPEFVLQKHITTHYNPTMVSEDWYWNTESDGNVRIHFKITSESEEPFELDYLIAPVTATIRDDDSSIYYKATWPSDDLQLDEATQYFNFLIHPDQVGGADLTEWLLSHSNEGVTASGGTGNVPFYIDTEGRENNPIYFINSLGMKVNPGTDGAIPVSGDYIHRQENDLKRRIKIIAPSLIEQVIKDYEEEL